MAYPQPKDAEAFDAVYEKEHVPMAIAKLAGKTRIVATKVLQSPQGAPPFHRIAEVHFPSMEALQRCADGGEEAFDELDDEVLGEHDREEDLQQDPLSYQPINLVPLRRLLSDADKIIAARVPGCVAFRCRIIEGYADALAQDVEMLWTALHIVSDSLQQWDRDEMWKWRVKAKGLIMRLRLFAILYRTGFHFSGPAPDERALMSLEHLLSKAQTRVARA